jgi:hypothetical protein
MHRDAPELVLLIHQRREFERARMEMIREDCFNVFKGILHGVIAGGVIWALILWWWLR